MVSNRLPVRMNADGSLERTAGGLASALEGAELPMEQVWVGWPGITTEDCGDPAEVSKSLNEIGVWPVFLA